MTHRTLSLFLCALALAGWPLPPAAAQGGDREAVRMEEVVVTAPPITEGNRVNRLASQVSTVTEDQIGDLNAQDFQSAVRMVPGVIISRQNPVGSFGGGDGGAVYIRGMGSSRPGGEVQTAVDGIPKVVGVWSHPLMDIMSVDRAQRIDIYKGAQPVLFGNGAYGVVNVITKRQTEEGSTRMSGPRMGPSPPSWRGSSTAARSATPIITSSRASAPPAATGISPAASCRNTSPGSAISSMSPGP
jgi:iron complex outermembrane receptor protein